MIRILRAIGRVIRPHVYTVKDYAALAERDPEAITLAEIDRLARSAILADRPYG